MSSTPSTSRVSSAAGSPVFTLALFAVVLVVVFTVAFWVGRAVGPAPDDPRPDRPMTHADGAGR